MSRALAPLLAASLALSGCGGTPRVTMPELRGKTKRAALGALGSRRLCVVGEDVADWPAAARARLGTVVDQDPMPGVVVQPSSEVRLWIRMRSRTSSVVAPGCHSYFVKNVSVSG